MGLFLVSSVLWITVMVTIGYLTGPVAYTTDQGPIAPGQ